MIDCFDPRSANQEELLKLRCDSQSLSFYSDIAGFMSRHIAGVRSATLLDVGARTAAGTALLRAIHHPSSFARLKLSSVTALDLDEDVIRLAQLQYPDIELMAADVSSLIGARNFDIVLSSHTIEHVQDPDGFLSNLRALANACVIIACPFAEDSMSEGHVNRFDMQFFERHNFTSLEIYRSQHWHGSMACIGMLKI
jgi:2-polyprenyl-3-methyl-5-hydroxy-6-metoxy-1,4-benzoquinol methylase